MVAAAKAPAKRTKRKAAQRNSGQTNGAPRQPVNGHSTDEPAAEEPREIQLLGGGAPANETESASAATESESDSPATESAESVEPESQPAPQPQRRFGPPEGMYPEDAELFSFTPPSTRDTIWFPMSFKQPNAVQMWEIHDKPWHYQTWQYMKWASVPMVMQRKAVELLDSAPDEYLDMFNQWMAVNGAQPGSNAVGE